MFPVDIVTALRYSYPTESTIHLRKTEGSEFVACRDSEGGRVGMQEVSVVTIPLDMRTVSISNSSVRRFPSLLYVFAPVAFVMS
jgi:hypothetical protein